MTTVESVLKLQPSNAIVLDETEKEYFWNVILQYWKLPALKHFPGPNPISLERCNFEKIHDEDFMASLKTDGVRYLFVMTTKPNSLEPISLMVDRALNMFEIEVWANEDFFYNGSLFDGELVWNTNGNLQFVIFDVVLLKGEDCISCTYRERLQIIHNHILLVDYNTKDDIVEQLVSEEDKIYARNNDFFLQMIPKICVGKEHIKDLWEGRDTSSHRNDGIILTLNDCHVHTGTSKYVFKWKPSHSIDIKSYFQNGTWSFFANDNASDDEINISSSIGDKKVRVNIESKLLEALERKFVCVIECLLQITEDGSILLIPERERSDKKTANTLKTMIATIKNANENISAEELFHISTL